MAGPGVPLPSFPLAVAMSRLIVAVAWCALAGSPLAQTVGGTVTDAETGGVLIGAAVYAPGLGRGAVTNAYGHYSLPLPSDSVRLVVSYAGYQPAERRASDAVAGRLDVALSPRQLGEVVVEAGARPEATPQMGQAALSGRDVEALPALLGEGDVLKAIQLLPGVRGGAEGTAGLYVRGGSPDQTLILLDGVPVYNATHLFGFLSAFNSDAVARAELTKGAYPARFGGRLASVLDVRLRDGDLERYRVSGQVGLISTRLLAEGPLVPGRASVLVSARRTHVNLLARPFLDRANRDAEAAGTARIEPRLSFSDLHAKATWQPSDRDRVYLSLYGGGDAFSFTATDPTVSCSGGDCAPTGEADETGGGLDWSTVTGSFRATRAVSPRLFGALTLTASDYDFDVEVSQTEGLGGPDPAAAAAVYRSGIRDLAGRLDVDWAAAPAHTVRLGASVARHAFTPGALSVTGDDAQAGAPADSSVGSSRSVGVEAAAYAEDEWRIGPALTLAVGVRAAVYGSGRWRYPSVEPRASASLRVLPRLALQASAATTQQPVHLLTTGAGIGLPADLWVPADSIGPQRGRQVAVGLAGSSASGKTTWSVEGYWRSMRGLVSYREGAAFTTPFEDWQELVVTGEGRSRGVEVLVRHRADRLTAWAAYTLSRTDRRFDALASGAWFPYRYDRRHDVSAVALVRLTDRLDVSAALAWATGDAVTLPAALYDATYLGESVQEWALSPSYSASELAYGARNGYRLPAYVRLDLGATWFFRRGPRPHAVVLSVYNATNRKNPFATTLEDRADPATGAVRQQLVGISLFPILPTLAYRFAL